ncbi:histone H1-delta-like [Haliotis cracherodii]|uniref:histone H1-delta-like n=1 Tax=Haliotis cracherodii TaxID=6455 RepID=UPI0039E9B3AD
MADAAQTKSPAKAPAKKRASKPKKPSSHPKYCDMIAKAIAYLKERGGSSRQAILKYILANFKVDANSARNHLKMALRAGVKNGTLKQSKGVGASGSFRLGDKAEKAKKPKAKKATKPKAAGAKKVKKPKAAGAKKSPAKAKKPKAKKSPAKKAPKPKAARKSPAKKAAKPKKAKAPKKKAAAKK